MNRTGILFMLLVPLILAVLPARAEDQAGTVVALRGKGTILRGGSTNEMKLKSAILTKDTLGTAEGARAKLLFIDDSVLTLGEKSQLSVSEFLHSRQDRGRSVFNLLDGKLRAVVGKTKFEVRTPTAVAAARGTIIQFDVGKKDGRPYTTIVCKEGVVDVWSATAEVSGRVELMAGMMVTIFQGEQLPQPATVPTGVLRDAEKATSTSGSEISVPEAHVLVPGRPPVTARTTAAGARTSDRGQRETRGNPEGTDSTPGRGFPPVPILVGAPAAQQPVVKQPSTVVIGIGF